MKASLATLTILLGLLLGCSSAYKSKVLGSADFQTYSDLLTLQEFTLADEVLWVPLTTDLSQASEATPVIQGYVCRPYFALADNGLISWLRAKNQVIDVLAAKNSPSPAGDLVFESLGSTDGQLATASIRRLHAGFAKDSKTYLLMEKGSPSQTKLGDLNESNAYKQTVGRFAQLWRGAFFNGLAHGQSVNVSSFGWKEESSFFHDLRIGPGTLTYPSGASFAYDKTIGRLSDTRPLFTPATGIFTDANGVVTSLNVRWYTDGSSYERVTSDLTRRLDLRSGTFVKATAGLLVDIPYPAALKWTYSTGFCTGGAGCTPDSDVMAAAAALDPAASIDDEVGHLGDGADTRGAPTVATPSQTTGQVSSSEEGGSTSDAGGTRPGEDTIGSAPH